MTGNRKKANARHEQVVDQHACCVRGHRDIVVVIVVSRFTRMMRMK